MKSPSITIPAFSPGSPGDEIVTFFLNNSAVHASDFPCHVLLDFDHGQQGLIIEFELLNDIYVEENNYNEDNSPMWNQEVFELFISAGAETPTRYMEIEVNPNGALFSAWVTNTDGTGSKNAVDLFEGRDAGIGTSVVREKNSWRGKILIPLSLLGALQDHYRLNFYRIVSLQSHDLLSSWACSADSCAFLAWSPTLSGDTPNFHVPARFGHLYLK